MAHKYNPENGATGARFLNSTLRKWFLSPERVLQDIVVNPSDIWADVGCGNGFFTLPLAKKASRVYAIDISKKMLEMLRSSLAVKEVDNVDILLSEENKLPSVLEMADGALLAFVAHELTDPRTFFYELAKLVKPGGRVVLIEFSKKFSFGPPMNERISSEQADEWARQAGFRKGADWKWSRSTIGLEYRLDR